MMATARVMSHLIDRLPPVRGRLSADAPMAPFTWFRTGGPAEVLFRPADTADLAAFLRNKPADVPVTVIGVGSNLLVRDGGIPGVVIRLAGRAFGAVAVDGTVMTVGAGALDTTVAAAAQEHGIAGLEFLSGIPGTIGGAVRMNAGAYDGEIKDVFAGAEAVDGTGNLRALRPEDMGFAYRHTDLAADIIITRATLRGSPGDKAAIATRLEEIRTRRGDTQPVRARTGGSTFANPPGDKAWRLIDAAGCRGLRRGDAMISDKHCNFLINTGSATAADLEGLGEEVRRRVAAATGVELQWEIRRIGIGKGGAANG